jgi:hypothetical protein
MKLRNITIVAISALASLFAQMPVAVSAQSLSRCDVQIVGREWRSRVNLRNGAGTEFGSPGYVLVGQSVNMLNNSSGRRVSREDSQGYVWYMVEYLPSSTRGWIREDFISQQCN